MSITEVLYIACILLMLAAASAGLSKLKQALKRYASSACACKPGR